MSLSEFLRDVLIAALVIEGAGFLLGCGAVGWTVWREKRRGG